MGLCCRCVTEWAEGAFMSGAQWRAFGKVGSMSHPVEHMFRATSQLSWVSPFDTRESIYERRNVFGPSRGFVGIYPFHISLLPIVVEATPLGSFPHRAVEGSIPISPMPGSRWCEG